MGKQKCQRRKLHKENPTGLLSLKDLEDCEGSINEDREKAIERVLEEIQSSNIEEKLSGLQTLESMSYNATMAVDLVNNSIAKIIGPYLVDANVSIRAATSYALRHIADNGGENACAVLLKDDLMTPLSMLLNEYYNSNGLKYMLKEHGASHDTKEALVEVVTLLWTLCENNDSAVNYANQNGFIHILIKFLDIPAYSIDVSIIAAQCILSLSEDNPIAIELLKSNEELLLNLMALEANDDQNVTNALLLKVVIAGIMTTIISTPEYKSDLIIKKILSVLAECLAINYQTSLNDLVGFLSPDKKEFPNTAKKKIHEIRQLLGAQQQALESFANLCLEDEKINEDSDVENSDFEYESNPADDYPIGGKLVKCTSILSVESMEMINHLQLTKEIWRKTATLNDATRLALVQNVEGRHVLKHVHTLRCRAYLCLNNLIPVLELNALGGVDDLYRHWIETGTVIFKDASPNDIELLESASAAMRAVLDKLIEVNANVFQEISLNDIEPIINSKNQCTNANVRANLIRILGSLTLMFIKDCSSSKEEFVKRVTMFLLDSCSTEVEVWIIAEVLDVIMDIYGDDESNQIAADIQLTAKLRSIMLTFKDKYRQQKKRLGSNALIVSTVNSNINRFIKYKERLTK